MIDTRIVEIKLDEIKIEPSRFRKEINQESLQELAQSIKENGLIQPIIIDDDNTLVDGERRYRAHVLLGKETIQAIQKSKLTEDERKIVEFSANECRLDFTWQERVKAIAEIHEMLCRKYPDWSMIKTGEKFGKTNAWVSEAIRLAREMDNDEEVAKQGSWYDALKHLKMRKEREAIIALTKKVKEQSAPKKEQLTFADERCLLGDCRDILPTIPDCSHVIVTDPIFGVDIGDSKKGDIYDIYEDDPLYFKQLLIDIAPELFRITPNDSFIVMFYGWQHYQFIIDVLSSAGFRVWHIPGLWIKSNETGQSSRPDENFTSRVEPFLIGKKGKPHFTHPSRGSRPNTFEFDTVPWQKKIHETEKPVPLLKEIIEWVTFPSQKVLDPFGGSFATLIAAIMAGRDGLVIEKDELKFYRAKNRLKHFLQTGKIFEEAGDEQA